MRLTHRQNNASQPAEANFGRGVVACWWSKSAKATPAKARLGMSHSVLPMIRKEAGG